MQYYAHHIGDFIKHTANLDDHHLATYLRMLWKYYIDESPLPDSCEDLAFALRSDEKTVQTLLKHFFFMKDGLWVHARCEKVIEDFYNKSEKARASAKSRWNKKSMQTQSERIANASKSDADSMLPITHNPKPITVSKDTKTTRAAKKCPDDFVITEQMRDWAISEGLLIDIDLETKVFKDHTFTSAKSDWLATWRNWIRRANGFKQKTGALTQKESFKEKDAKAARELYERVTGKVHPENPLFKPLINSMSQNLIEVTHEPA
jgi:uncharacterized protein YdaU (DUF1376 family)